MPKADLIREGAKLFGYSRAWANVELAMANGIEKAIQLGIANESDGRIVFKG